jgi:hypothetical protein
MSLSHEEEKEAPHRTNTQPKVTVQSLEELSELHYRNTLSDIRNLVHSAKTRAWSLASRRPPKPLWQSGKKAFYSTSGAF